MRTRFRDPYKEMASDLLPRVLVLLGSLVFTLVVWGNPLATVGVGCFALAALMDIRACVLDWLDVMPLKGFHKPEFGDGTLSGGSERGNRFED